jgi:hypothetical protein
MRSMIGLLIVFAMPYNAVHANFEWSTGTETCYGSLEEAGYRRVFCPEYIVLSPKWWQPTCCWHRQLVQDLLMKVPISQPPSFYMSTAQQQQQVSLEELSVEQLSQIKQQLDEVRQIATTN